MKKILGWLKKKNSCCDKVAKLIDLLAQREDELNRRNKELERRNQLISAFMDCLPDLLWAKDLQGKYLWANAKHLEWLGATAFEEAVGKTDVYFAEKNRKNQVEGFHTFGELCANSDAETLQRNCAFYAREFGNVRGVECQLMVSKAPMRDASGKVIGVVGSGQDITNRMQRGEQIISGFEAVVQEKNCAGCADNLEKLKILIRGGAYDNRRK